MANVLADEGRRAELAVDAVAAARTARHTRETADAAEAHAVALGRDAGISWDTLGQWLGRPGETLRRKYA